MSSAPTKHPQKKKRLKVIRHALVWVAALLLTGKPLTFQSQSTASPGKMAAPQLPNILVILTDDQGYGNVTSFGAPDLQTPHIDTMVKSGMKLINFHANSSVCSPTRASLLSGRYPELQNHRAESGLVPWQRPEG